MALADTLVGSVALIALAIALVGLFRLSRQYQAAPASSGGGERPKREVGKVYSIAEIRSFGDVEETTLLSRFVQDTAGERVGETLAFHGALLVLKQEGTYFAVPQEMVLEKDGNLVASPDLDWDAARVAGQAWYTDTRDEMTYDDAGLPVDA